MRCLLAADLDVNHDSLRRTLRLLDVDLVEIDRLGIDWLTQSPVPPVDFVCAALRDRGNHDAEVAVFVDIGVALGREIPVFLIVEPPRKAPLVLAGLTRVEADLNNQEALELHLRHFLQTIRRHKPRPETASGPRPALSMVDAELAHTRLHAIQPATGAAVSSGSQRFERLILDLLDTAGNELSNYQETKDFGHDLALWANEAGPVLGGPVLIQLKLWSETVTHGLRNAIEAFGGQVKKQQVPFGLLIHHSMLGDRKTPSHLQQPYARVVALSADEFIDLLAAQPLSRLLISMRNAVMHGVPYRG